MTLLKQDAQHVWHPFRQEKNAMPLLPIVRGKGAVLYTQDNTEYLDLVSSWWVTTHGHAHPKIAKAIGEQALSLEQALFADITHPPAVELGQKLTSLLPSSLSRVFYSDNGSTSVEIALKMAYQYWYNQGQEHRRHFISLEGGYHGDTFGAMAVGKSSGFYKPFAPFLFNISTIPYPATWMSDEDVESKENEALSYLDEELKKVGNDTAAIILEPLIQGASGMRICRPSFIQKLVQKAREFGILVIFDEVMTGFGRTGSLFACQKAEVSPDLICLSKGLTGGFLPLAVTVVQDKIYKAFFGDTFDKAFAHAHSFTANPLGCAAALAALSLYDEEMTLDKIQKIEEIHQERLSLILKEFSIACKPRIMGSIAAFEISQPAGQEGYNASIGRTLKEAFFKRGLFMRPLGNVVYLMPPYCITPEQLHKAYDGIYEILREL